MLNKRLFAAASPIRLRELKKLFSRKRYEALGCFFLLLGLSACGSIFDPAPYEPFDKSTYQNAGDATSSAAILLSFTSLDDASAKLLAMSMAYDGESKDLSRQQLIFDIPAIGLGVASLVSLSFHGVASATTGLGLGAATVYGSKTYFEPGTKITAYASASQSLLCASSSASGLAGVKAIYQNEPAELQTQMMSDIVEASTILTGDAGGSLTADQKTSLLNAYSNAQKALTDLTGSITTLNEATIKLQSFAIATIQKTDSTIQSGVPNPASVVSSIKSTFSSGNASAALSAGAPAPVPGPLGAAAAAPATVVADAQTLTNNLVSEATNAEAISQAINNQWSTFSTCTTSS